MGRRENHGPAKQSAKRGKIDKKEVVTKWFPSVSYSVFFQFLYVFRLFDCLSWMRIWTFASGPMLHTSAVQRSLGT